MKAEPKLFTSVLNAPENLPLHRAESVADWGKTLVVAPHPDDESLGCGGAIALLREFETEVKVLVLSDGTLSHPHSRRFPAEKLRGLRENEMLKALALLGVSGESTTFFRYRDRSVPHQNSSDFEFAVRRCLKYLQDEKPQTILVPWRRDPHPDHCAAWQLINAAQQKISAAWRIIEYPIWLWELAKSNDAPRFDEVAAWRLDIKKVRAKKHRAIYAHASQTTDLIDDDPQGFRLTADILAHFAGDYEVYLESI